MSERTSKRGRNIRSDNSGRRSGTAVLLAVASLLGTSLGVAAATLPGPMVPAEKRAAPPPALGSLAEQGAGATVRIASNQLKWRSNQQKVKLGESRSLNFTKPGDKGKQKGFPTETIKRKKTK
jgi:hypothetical protein